MHRGAYGAEIPRIADDLDIFIEGRDELKDRKRIVGGRVVNEEVFIVVTSERTHDRADAFVNLADVIFFIEAWSEDGDGFLHIASVQNSVLLRSFARYRIAHQFPAILGITAEKNVIVVGDRMDLTRNLPQMLAPVIDTHGQHRKPGGQ